MYNRNWWTRSKELKGIDTKNNKSNFQNLQELYARFPRGCKLKYTTVSSFSFYNTELYDSSEKKELKVYMQIQTQS